MGLGFGVYGDLSKICTRPYSVYLRGALAGVWGMELRA